MEGHRSLVHAPPSLSGGGGGSGSRFEPLAGERNGNSNSNSNSNAVVQPRRAGTAGTCTKCGGDYSFCTYCADGDCEEKFCNMCRESLPECSRCFEKACEGSGSPDTDCFLPCEGNTDCWNGVCRLCKEARSGCAICDATVCLQCNEGCSGCSTVCCAKCARYTSIPGFCEGCNATSCLLCMMHRNPCTLCGHVVSMERLREAYERTGFVRKWLELPGLPPDAQALRAQVARCWVALLKDPKAVIAPARRSVHVIGGSGGGGGCGGGGGGGGAGYSAGKITPSLQQPAATQPPREGYPNLHNPRQNGGDAARELWAGSKVAAVVGGRWSAQEGRGGMGAGGGLAGEAGARCAGAAPVRASLEAVQRFVAFTTSVRPAQQQQQQQQGVTLENIKRFFAGWVDPDVVELYYETTRDTNATVRQCQEIVQQVVTHEKHADAAGTIARPQPPPSSWQQPKPYSAADAAAAAAAAAAREQAGRVAAARAVTVERAMARVAAQAESEREAKEAAAADTKRKAYAEAEAEDARRAWRQQQEQQEQGQRERAAATAAGAAMSGSGGGGGGSGGGGDGGGATETVASLEDRLKKAIDRGDALAIQSIYDEAMRNPGASMKSSKTKIRKKCRNWLNKRAGEEQKQLQASQATQAIPVPRGAGAGGAGAAAAAAWATQRLTQFEIFCPNHIAGYLIGTRGQTVNRLMRESRAKIVLKTYQDRSGHDVVITGPPAAVQTARHLVGQFYRSKGVEPTTLPPPSTAVRVGALATPPSPRAGAFATPPSPRAGLPNPAVPAEAMIRRLGRATSERMEAAGPRGVGLQRAPPPPPFLSGGGSGGGGPAINGDSGGEVELLRLLQVARCEHHLERFSREKLDEEVLLDMEREDFARMGVSEAEQVRILNALKRDDDVADDGEDLDQDHPDTCKICFCNRVDILFLPCRHQCTCSGCGAGFTGKPCIICRATVERAQRVIRMPRK